MYPIGKCVALKFTNLPSWDLKIASILNMVEYEHEAPVNKILWVISCGISLERLLCQNFIFVRHLTGFEFRQWMWLLWSVPSIPDQVHRNCERNSTTLYCISKSCCRCPLHNGWESIHLATFPNVYWADCSHVPLNLSGSSCPTKTIWPANCF